MDLAALERDVVACQMLSGSSSLIEILLPGGVPVRVDAQVNSRVLRLVLGALEGR